MQVAVSWGLDESAAVTFGLEKNYDIQILKGGKALDSLDIRKLRAKWLPSAGIAGLYENRFVDSSRLQTPIGNFGNEDKFQRKTMDLHVNQNLPGGGMLSGTSSLIATDHDKADSSAYGVRQSVSLTIPLLKDAWGDSPLEYSLRIAGFEKSALNQQRKLDILFLIAEIRALYWQLYGQLSALELSREKEAFFQRQLNFVRMRMKIGSASEMDTLFQSLELAKAEQNTLEGSYGVKILKLRLANMIGVDTSSLGMDPARELDVPELPPETAIWDSIKACDPSLRSFEITRKRWEEESNHWKTGLLPSVDLGLVQSFSRDGVHPTGASSAFQNNVTAQIRVSYDLPVSDQTLSLKQSRIEARISSLNHARRELELKDSLAVTVSAFEVLRLTLANLERSKTMAAKQLSLSEQKFGLGQLDRLSLQKSRDDFDEISNSLMDTRIQLKLRQVLLESLDGSVLREYDIQ